jgi:hypothetical protein
MKMLRRNKCRPLQVATKEACNHCPCNTVPMLLLQAAHCSQIMASSHTACMHAGFTSSRVHVLQTLLAQPYSIYWGVLHVHTFTAERYVPNWLLLTAGQPVSQPFWHGIPFAPAPGVRAHQHQPPHPLPIDHALTSTTANTQHMHPHHHTPFRNSHSVAKLQ